jgi:ElaB/YqjD/DUF883 family membrane-anchored ribosome-binding protein
MKIDKTGHGDEKVFEHPSYCMVQFSRCQGNPGRLFGSPLQEHGSFVTLRVVEAERRHSLSRDWYFGGSKTIVEIYLSPMQFAELLTTMNVSSGVPGTLRFHGQGPGKIAKPPEDEEIEADVVARGFKEDIERIGTELKELQAKAEEILGSKGPVKAEEKKEILNGINKMVRDIVANLPFVLESFQEATERTVKAAKAEVDAFVTTAVMATGLDALQQMKVTALDVHSEGAPQLGSKDTPRK